MRIAARRPLPLLALMLLSAVVMIAATAESRTVETGPAIARVIGRFLGDPDGPTLVAVGSIHGNEPAGRLALERVAKFLKTVADKVRGRVYLLTGNLSAAQKGVRFIDHDLNRWWTRENIIRNTRPGGSDVSEDREQYELLQIFGEILRKAGDEVFVLDLHSTSAEGVPFATVGDTMRNRRFATKFPVNVLLGIEEQLEGTLLEFLNNEGAVTLGFEAGQHVSQAAIDNHEALVISALVETGILAATDVPGYSAFTERLQKATGEKRIVEIRHREPVSAEDRFEMKPGFQNFDPITRGQPLASNIRGAITAPEGGMIMMPLYQEQGEDGFFVIRRVAPVWLKISAALRAVDAARVMRLLPGVRQERNRPEVYLVDTRIARFFPLQIFHLLGFRRLQVKGSILYVTRRRFDRRGPFGKRGT